MIPYLFSVQSLGRVERLYQCRRMADEERVARGPGEHADHRQPDVRGTLRRISPVADAKHVRQSLEQRPRVLLCPVCPLLTNE